MGWTDQYCFCCSGGDGAGLGRMMVLRTAAATAKSQDGVGNDWFGRTSVPLALLLLAFFVRGSGVRSRKPTRKTLKIGEIYFFLDLHLHGKASPGWTVQGNGK